MRRIFYSNITYACNNNCTNCISHSVRNKVRDSLTVSDFRIIDELFHVRNVDIWNINGGEPTLANQLPDIIDFCYERSHHIILYSNGRNLGRLSDLSIEKLERIIVPLYGNEELHDSYVQVNGAFQETVNSLLHIIEKYPEKCDIKLLISGPDSIQALLLSPIWSQLYVNRSFSISRVLSGYKDVSPCSSDINAVAENLIKDFVADNKIVRFYDFPFCQFSNDFQNNIINSIEVGDDFDSEVISIFPEGKWKVSNFNAKTNFYSKCLQCTRSSLCTMIMKNYFCPIIYNGKCRISTE